MLRKRITLTLGLLVVTAAVFAYATKSASNQLLTDQSSTAKSLDSKSLYNESIDPYQQVQTALEQSRSQRKTVLIQIGGNWCPDARRLDVFYDEHPQLKQWIDNHFIFVRVNLDRENPHQIFDKLPKFSWVPTWLLLDENSRFLAVKEGRQLEDVNREYDSNLMISFLKNFVRQ